MCGGEEGESVWRGEGRVCREEEGEYVWRGGGRVCVEGRRGRVCREEEGESACGESKRRGNEGGGKRGEGCP